MNKLNRYDVAFIGESYKAFKECLNMVPHLTGKLRNEGVKFKAYKYGSRIKIDLTLCPYGQYINEPFTNKNGTYVTHVTDGWWEKFLDAYAQKLKEIQRKEKIKDDRKWGYR